MRSEALRAMGVDWGEPLVPPSRIEPTLAAQVKGILGFVPPDFGAFREAPWIARSMARAFAKRHFHTSFLLLELASLVTAQENACRYCYGGQRAAVRLLGYREEQLDRLERDHQLGEHTPLEKAVLDFARQLARSNPRPAGREIEALKAAGCSDLQVAEIAWITAASCLVNRISTFAALRPLTRFESWTDKPWIRLVRPLLVRRLGKRVFPPPGPAPQAPFRRVLDSQQGTWGRFTVAEDLNECLASPGLGRATRLAVFAVVARALDCGYCAQEARLLLEADGIAHSDAEEAVNNLHAPWLGPAEAKILGWARDTVRNRAIDMQRRTRTLSTEIGPAKTMEAIGTASLANMVVRLAMLVPPIPRPA